MQFFHCSILHALFPLRYFYKTVTIMVGHLWVVDGVGVRRSTFRIEVQSKTLLIIFSIAKIDAAFPLQYFCRTLKILADHSGVVNGVGVGQGTCMHSSHSAKILVPKAATANSKDFDLARRNPTYRTHSQALHGAQYKNGKHLCMLFKFDIAVV